MWPSDNNTPTVASEDIIYQGKVLSESGQSGINLVRTDRLLGIPYEGF